jgi:hypothetical protein
MKMLIRFHGGNKRQKQLHIEPRNQAKQSQNKHKACGSLLQPLCCATQVDLTPAKRAVFFIFRRVRQVLMRLE